MRLNLEFVTSYDRDFGGSFTDDELDSLRKQGVTVEDWDIAIFAPVEVLEEYFDVERVESISKYGHVEYRDEVVKKFRVEYDLHGLIDSSCAIEPRWYLVNWKGEECALGIKYH